MKQYAALIFANSNQEAFENEEQRAALRRFIRRGGGFMGIHSSTGSERQWNWFQQMQGAKFLRHPPQQQFTPGRLKTYEPDGPTRLLEGRGGRDSVFCRRAVPSG